jgi:signal transduction histidine kinase
MRSVFLERVGSFITPTGLGHAEKWRRVLAALVVGSAAPILYGFALLHLFRFDLFMGGFLLFAALALSTSFYLIGRYKDARMIYRVNLVLIGIMFIYLLMVNAPKGYMGFWLFIYPLTVFFLLGEREGTLFNTVLFFLVICLFCIQGFLPGLDTYEIGFKVRFFIALFLIGMMGYWLEFVRNRFEMDILDKQAKLVREKEKLAESRKAAEAANRAKSEFLANMSHELRTPLNHIIGFTELVADKNFGGLNETQEEYLNDVLDSGRHLLSLINDILDLSKVEAGRLDLDVSDVDLRHLLESSLVLIKEKALKHGIRLTMNLDGIPESIRADERKVKQILYNLLSNAAKFTPDGGEIELSARRLNGDQGGEDGEVVEVAVRDTGIGLRRGDLERIFDPFEQVEQSRNRKYQGTGLGLSLTKSLVELHGGQIRAESEGEGKGSTFRFTIPGARGEEMLKTSNERDPGWSYPEGNHFVGNE